MAGLANGRIVVLYSPEHSTNGAKLVMSKGPPRKVTIEDMSDALSAPAIITPHALPMFRDMDPGRGTKRKREKDRMDPRKSHRPELPVTGPGRGGRVGASATQHVVQNLVRDTTRDVDVRCLPLLMDRALNTELNILPAPRSSSEICGYGGRPQMDGWWVFPNRIAYVAMALTAVFSETLFAAWKVNQPKPVFAEEPVEEKEEDVL